MSQDPKQNPLPPMFSIDVSASPSQDPTAQGEDTNTLLASLMRRMIAEQEKSNQLLAGLLEQTQNQQKQRGADLQRWKEANPELAEQCREAAEILGKVQNEFLSSVTDEVTYNEDALVDSDYMLQEFVDRFGPRLAHLNGVLQVVSQLAAPKDDS